MVNVNNMNGEIENVFSSKRDDSIDVLAAIADIENETEASNEKEEKLLTPLEEAMRAKKESTQGMVISNKELEEGAHKGPTKDIIHGTREENFSTSLDELDNSIARRKAVVVLKRPVSQQDYMTMMMEIEAVKFKSDGSTYFDIGPEKKDDNDNVIESHSLPENYKPQFVRLRNENDPPFSEEEFKNFTVDDATQKITYGNKETKTEDKTENRVESTIAALNGETDEKAEGFGLSDKDKQNIQILIDKTGLGIDYQFTEEERAKIRNANEIVVKEVKEIDISSYLGRKSSKSFQDYIDTYNCGNERVTICFPASGFKAQMRGMSYGEYQDIALSMENITTDIYHKRLSVIYNCMTNISTGPFDSFEEFLDRFSFSDMDLALYGLFVATEAETQEIELHCNVPECNAYFQWKYDTRSVIRLDRSPAVALEKMKELASATASEYSDIRDRAIVNSSKYIELPDSKYIVEVGLASCHDFIYNVVPILDNDGYKEVFGKDLDENGLSNVLLLTGIRSIRIPVDDGLITCETNKDILDALYRVSPNEIKIIAAYVTEVQNNYAIAFSFGDVKCPKCGNITRNMTITMDDLVFQTFQTSMSTRIKLKNSPNF